MSTATAPAVKFSDWLLLRRRSAGLNQQELADALGIRRQTISAWETGKARPDLNPVQLQKLCGLLGVSFEELVEAFKVEG